MYGVLSQLEDIYTYICIYIQNHIYACVCVDKRRDMLRESVSAAPRRVCFFKTLNIYNRSSYLVYTVWKGGRGAVILFFCCSWEGLLVFVSLFFVLVDMKQRLQKYVGIYIYIYCLSIIQ